jgi:carboxyl-terminal processing protease
LLLPATPTQNLINEVVAALRSLNEERALGGLILDLRIATAGSGWPLSQMLALFSDGEMGELYTREETTPILVAGQNISDSQVLPLTIIVGPDTDGAPEIFAAALQATGRARLVGMPTPGSIEIVGQFPLPDGSRVFIATGSYRTPDGRDLGQQGIQPDVTVEVDWDEVTLEDDPVRDAAVRALAPPRQ